MDLLEQYVNDNLLSKENVLKMVDDYSILCHYIGEELETRTKYSSPLRQGDSDPSFSIFYSRTNENTLLYKDSALNECGNVFMFLQKFLNCDMREVLLQINSDFGLGFEGDDVGEFKPHLIKKPPMKKAAVKISINSYNEPTEHYVRYWKMYGISDETLKKYYCTNVRLVHYDRDYRSTISTKTLTIGYEILGHYKIYQPFGDKKFKFRNDFPETYVEGALQLGFKQPFVIITKATKECMFFYEHFGWESVAGKSETTPIPERFIKEVLLKRYDKVFIWLDNDTAGCTSQDAYVEKYPELIPLKFPENIEEKDPTDYYVAMKIKGLEKEALETIKSIIKY